MKRSSIFVCMLLAALVAAQTAFAQVITPGGSRFNPPMPPPPPPPKIEAPVVPQMDAPIRQSYEAPPRRSFSDRIASCLDEAAANGIRASRRAAYSRACANQ
jgi:hypothetical protein